MGSALSPALAPAQAGPAHRRQEEKAGDRGHPGLQSAEAPAQRLDPRRAVRADTGEGERYPGRAGAASLLFARVAAFLLGSTG